VSAAVDIVKAALQAINAHSETLNPADPEVLVKALGKLKSLLSELVGDEIYCGSKLTSLTSAGTTATGTQVDHGFTADREVVIAGAAEDAYNGRFAIVTVPDADTFTYTIPEAADTPASAAVDARGITALQIPDELGDEVGEQDAATNALEYMLAPRCGPICRVPVSGDVKGEALRGLAALKRLFQLTTIPNLVPSRLLPRGQGSSRGPNPSTFFSGETLDDDSAS
jgi:hypothetical protein